MGRPLTAPEAYAEGLVLTAKGVADPNTKKRKSARQGLHQISARDGSLWSRPAVAASYREGLMYDSPSVKRRAHLVLGITLDYR